MMNLAEEKRKAAPFLPLHRATILGDLQTVKLLIEEGENPLSGDIMNSTQLHYAAQRGEYDILKYLIEEVGCNAATKGWQGSTALHATAGVKSNQLPILKYLVEQCQLDPCIDDDNNQSPLFYACASGNLAHIRYLMDCMQEQSHMQQEDILYGYSEPWMRLDESKVKDLSQHSELQHSTEPMIAACLYGNLSAVKYFLDDCKYDLTKKRAYKNFEVLISPMIAGFTHGSSALMAAVQNGHEKVVELLLKRGAKVEKQENDGISPLMFASQLGHYEVVKLFLDNGDDVDRVDNEGYSAIMFASKKGHWKVVKLLLEKGSYIDQQENENGWSALMQASRFGHTKTVEVLLENGATVDLQKEDGWSALMQASDNGHHEIAKILLDHGANVNLEEEDGWTPLIIASGRGHEQVLKVLLDYGANVDSQLYENRMSALLFASQNGYYKVALLLLESGANINLCNIYGWSAFMVAKMMGHYEVARLLLLLSFISAFFHHLLYMNQ